MAALPDTPARNRAYWAGELARAKKRFKSFHDAGDQVVDAYRQQKADGSEAPSKDKYNILYSSTETIRPNLYAQSPKCRIRLRSKDTATDAVRAAAALLEGCIEYVMHEEELDALMDAVVEDYLLPGMGCAWVRYEATFEDKYETGEDGKPKPVLDEAGKPQQRLLDEMVKIEYTYWQDYLTGVSRSWKDMPWVGRRCYMIKEDATKRFSAAIAAKLKYHTREGSNRDGDNPSETAEIWEIWNKSDRTVYWYSDDCDELLDSKPDPLKLKDFFPCPRPLRAITNTRTFVPRALYSQYKAQADTLNVLTKRIRLLGEALRVVGMYDGSQPKLADALNPASGNRMIAVDSWAVYAQNGGMKGSVDWLPIDQVVATLRELLNAREICKAEIYEITGFSDIVRGVSKASETLGAQNIKADWAGARVKKLQYEVQRFARDLMALVGEMIAEHCDPTTIAVFSGISLPDPEAVKQDPALQQRMASFKGATDLIRNEMLRLAAIEIETDSTLLADEAAERDDRTKFLAAAGAFLQQAVPAAEATPELGPLLGAMLMFVVRTFPSSRPIEEEFEKVQQALATRAQNPQTDGDKDGKKAAAQMQMQVAQLNQQTQMQIAQMNDATKKEELQVRAGNESQRNQLEMQREQNRHDEKMLELQIRQAELQLRIQELAIQAQDSKTKKFTALHTAGMSEMGLEADHAERIADEDLEYEKLDHASEEAEAGRQHASEEAEAGRQHASEEAEAGRAHEAEQAASEAPSGGDKA
jgi:hypothetical protein